MCLETSEFDLRIWEIVYDHCENVKVCILDDFYFTDIIIVCKLLSYPLNLINLAICLMY